MQYDFSAVPRAEVINYIDLRIRDCRVCAELARDEQDEEYYLEHGVAYVKLRQQIMELFQEEEQA